MQEAQHGIASGYGCKHWDMLYAVVAAALNVLAGLCDEHIQDVLREIDQQDSTRALNGAGLIVSWRLPRNMSMRVRVFINEEIDANPDLPEEERVSARHAILA
ncbi:MAG: FliG C-terminal domain-containing protein [Candidatus Latescibacterota bacterium]